MSKDNFFNDKKSKIMSSNPFAIIKFLEDRFPEKAIFLPELRSMYYTTYVICILIYAF